MAPWSLYCLSIRSIGPMPQIRHKKWRKISKQALCGFDGLQPRITCYFGWLLSLGVVLEKSPGGPLKSNTTLGYVCGQPTVIREKYKKSKFIVFMTSDRYTISSTQLMKPEDTESYDRLPPSASRNSSITEVNRKTTQTHTHPSRQANHKIEYHR